MKYRIKRTSTFNKWLSKLKDFTAVRAISRRVLRSESGDFGDIKQVGAAIYEMRFFIGPGYRVYFTIQNNEVIYLLNGGDKDSQQDDIKKAHQILKELGN